MVLPKVRVIAIDQQLVQGATPQNAQKPARRVTVEVNRDQAERVSVATRLGGLWLAARPADTAHQPPDPHLAPPTVWASEDVAVPGHAATPDANHVVRVFPGAADSKEFHF
jgi:Flp pilus assembly protein CpaB